MKKKFSKALFVTLAVMILLTVIGLSTAFAASEGVYDYTVENGNATITDVRSSIQGELTIPSKLGGYPVTTIGERAFDDCEYLTKITIPDSVTSIAGHAFAACKSLTSITIPESVTSIGEWAFTLCYNLTSVKLPDSLTSIGRYAFYYCKNLSSITIPGSVTSIENGTFQDCESLTSITLHAAITNIGDEAFDSCDMLTDIVIPDSVTNIGKKAFFGCYGLTNIALPASIISIGDEAFRYCQNLESVIIPDAMKDIGKYVFNDCSKFTDVYYTGTQEQWEQIYIWYNTKLKNADIHYNYHLPEYTFVLSATKYTYSGSAKTPTVTVKDLNGKTLKKNVDYTIKYSSGRTAAGTYNVLVTVNGECPYTKLLSFKIKPINISTCTLKLSDTSYTFNGKSKTPTVTVTNSNGTKLTKNTHYTVTYSDDRINVGTYKVTVKMKGNYTGTKTLSFKINPVNISTCSLSLSTTSVTYNGKVRTPTVTVKNANGVKLTKDKHYTVTYASGRVNAGTYKVTVKMKGNYTGSKTLSFKITPINISKCSIALSTTSVAYNGEVRTPTVTVKNQNGVKLTKDKHYTVTYASGRKNVGTYNITVKMKGNYTGSKTLKFTIKPTIKTSVNMLTGDTLKIGAKSNTKITYKSSNTSIAKVSSSGVITAVKTGSVTITVTSNKISQKITVKITKPSIKLNKTSASIGVYNSLTLKATVNPSNATVKWASSNTSVAKVSSKGKITPVKTGTCTITASFVHNGKTYKASCSIKIVSQQPITITALDWDINSVGGVEPIITIRNNTNKDIKYIEMTSVYKNRYGDPAYCEIWNTNKKTLLIDDGVDAKETATFYWDAVLYNNSVHRIDITTIKITFVDNKVITIKYNKSWHDKYYYYQ